MNSKRKPASTLSVVSAAALIGFGLYRLSKRRNNYSFAGRNVLITGGSRGLGLTIARVLARESANLIICARKESELSRAVSELRGIGASVKYHVCDVTDRSAVEGMFERIGGEYGSLDVLINNAGQILAGPYDSMSESDFRDLMDVHMWGAYHTITSALPLLRRSSRPKIANVSSIGGLIPIPHLAAYSASKFALAGLTGALRAELKKEGIEVTLVAPGLMRTGSHLNAEFTGDKEAEYALFRLADAYPPMSMNVESAARRIIEAIRHGENQVIVGTLAKLAALSQALLPNGVFAASALVNQMLPSGNNRERTRGQNIPVSSFVRLATGHLDQVSQNTNEC